MTQKNTYDALVKEHRCYKCKKNKLGIEFYANKSERRGIYKVCIECYKQAEQDRKKFLCPECNLRSNKIDSNTLCEKCNKEFGLKQCSKCNELKFILVDFNTKKTICDDCC